jgi:hypothetical protein
MGEELKVSRDKKKVAPKSSKHVRKTVIKPRAPSSFKAEAWYSNAAQALAVFEPERRRRGPHHDDR